MKKLLVRLFLVGVLASGFVVPATVSAAVPDTPPQTDITGVITKDGGPVAGALVTISCNGKTTSDTSNAQGAYLGIFPIADCPVGATVIVTATKGGYSGSESKSVQGITTKLNIAIVNVSIPEYGWIGSILAAGTGLGAIMYSRKRLFPRAV